MTWHLSRHLPYRLSPYCLQNCLYHLPKHLMLPPRHQDVLSDSRKSSEICPNDDYNKQVKSQTTLVKLHVPSIQTSHTWFASFRHQSCHQAYPKLCDSHTRYLPSRQVADIRQEPVACTNTAKSRTETAM